jgi:hypothetical protein
MMIANAVGDSEKIAGAKAALQKGKKSDSFQVKSRCPDGR